jgi:hypothetical protein
LPQPGGAIADDPALPDPNQSQPLPPRRAPASPEAPSTRLDALLREEPDDPPPYEEPVAELTLEAPEPLAFAAARTNETPASP